MNQREELLDAQGKPVPSLRLKAAFDYMKAHTQMVDLSVWASVNYAADSIRANDITGAHTFLQKLVGDKTSLRILLKLCTDHEGPVTGPRFKTKLHFTLREIGLFP